MARCLICQKSAVSGNAVSHSQIHTKRKFKPNLQKVNGLILCTKCLRTIKKYNTSEELAAGKIEEQVELAKEGKLEEGNSEGQETNDKGQETSTDN